MSTSGVFLDLSLLSFFFFFFRSSYFISLSDVFTHICAPRVSLAAYWVQKTAFSLLELELKMLANRHVDAKRLNLGPLQKQLLVTSRAVTSLQTPPYFFFEAGFVIESGTHCFSQTNRSLSSWDLPVYHHSSHTHVFSWVLGLQIWVQMLTQQVCHWLNHFSSPFLSMRKMTVPISVYRVLYF